MKDKKNSRSDEEILNEVENLFSEEETKETTKKLTFDGRQYSLRIPKKFVEESEIDKDKDYFKISLHYPSIHSDEKPKLTIELIRENEEKPNT